MSATASRNKVMKLLGLSQLELINKNKNDAEHKDKNMIGQMYCKKELCWLHREIIEDKNSEMDIYLNKDEKFTINIKNNCNYNLVISTLNKTGDIKIDNINNIKTLKPNHIFSLCLNGKNDKYLAILIYHQQNTCFQASGNDMYMIYIANKSASLQKNHYITIYSSDIYSIRHKLNYKTNANWNIFNRITVYIHIMSVYILLLTLLLFTFYIGIGHKVLFISTVIASICGMYAKRINNIKTIIKLQKLMSFVVLIFCVTSYFYDGILMDMSCDKLTNLTTLQFVVFCLVTFEYAFQIAIFRLDNNNLLHHVFGWIGIALFSSWNIGGGVIILWLFDTLTNVIYYFEYNFSTVTYWIVFTLVRCVWYNYVSILSFQCGADKIIWFKYAILWWCVFANIYHFGLIYKNLHYLLKRKI